VNTSGRLRTPKNAKERFGTLRDALGRLETLWDARGTVFDRTVTDGHDTKTLESLYSKLIFFTFNFFFRVL
jgi:hypothetical protein